MKSVVQEMLETHACQNVQDYRNALKEIIQEIALLGLYRGGFFQHAAFYGGSALRTFHGLKRFSEDLDFSLMKPDSSFEWDEYLPYLRNELGAYGFDSDVGKKLKSNETAVRSAFIKSNTLIHLVSIAPIQPPVSGVPPNENLSIKLELDTDPPEGAAFELKYRLQPVPHTVRLYDTPSLFAGKIHALLCRSWQNRVKGRDYYDYLWYLAKKTPLNVGHLRWRLIQTGHLEAHEGLSGDQLKERLFSRFNSINFEKVKEDVLPFIADPRELDLWNADFFCAVTRDNL
jgi:predicted nucleotidyltransferase component of viral defense system